MHTQIRTTDCGLSWLDRRTIDRRMARLQKLLPWLDPDTASLRLTVERHPRRVEFRCSLRLVVGDEVLAATRQRANGLRGLLLEVFDRVEEQLKQVREIRADRRTRAGRTSVVGD